jgi:outer membrane lipoprotein-sorting protein
MSTLTSTRRSLLAGLAMSAFAGAGWAQSQPPGLSPDDRAVVERATAYLQGLTEARARFVQTDARGGVSRGTVYLRRPGKARFEYDPPSGLLVVSDGATVSVQDKRLKNFDQYPLGMTPLSLFLARNIRLDRGVSVSRIARRPNGFTIVARDGKKQTAGQIALTFTERPLTLTGWTVTDAQNRAVKVMLDGLEPAHGLDPGLFVLKDPRPPRNIGRGKL